jgi:molybdenum-dependent DNA-binding transcriptional regulator ModE
MERLAMSLRERKRLEVLSRVKSGELSLVEAAALLQLSYRQAKRVYRRYRQQGDRGLVHALRGRPSNRTTEACQRAKIVARYRERYRDFGPTLAAEYLAQDGLNGEGLRCWRRGRAWRSGGERSEPKRSPARPPQRCPEGDISIWGKMETFLMGTDSNCSGP